MPDPAALGSEALRARVDSALREVLDPEIGINIVDLGLVYSVVADVRDVAIRMTMTTPACPLSDQVMREVETKLKAIEGVKSVCVELVWDPPWTHELMSATAKAALGWSHDER